MIDCRDISVVVANYQAEMLKVLSGFLEQYFCLMAAVHTGDDLIRVTSQSWPDVIVADINLPLGEGKELALAFKSLGLDPLPVRDGLDLMLAFKALGIQIPFVLIGIETKGAGQFLEQGAAAYVHKADTYADLKEAVLVAAEGGKFASRSVTDGNTLQ